MRICFVLSRFPKVANVVSKCFGKQKPKKQHLSFPKFLWEMCYWSKFKLEWHSSACCCYFVCSFASSFFCQKSGKENKMTWEEQYQRVSSENLSENLHLVWESDLDDGQDRWSQRVLSENLSVIESVKTFLNSKNLWSDISKKFDFEETRNSVGIHFLAIPSLYVHLTC